MGRKDELLKAKGKNEKGVEVEKKVSAEPIIVEPVEPKVKKVEEPAKPANTNKHNGAEMSDFEKNLLGIAQHHQAQGEKINQLADLVGKFVKGAEERFAKHGDQLADHEARIKRLEERNLGKEPIKVSADPITKVSTSTPAPEPAPKADPISNPDSTGLKAIELSALEGFNCQFKRVGNNLVINIIPK